MGLITIHLYLKKLYSRFHFWRSSLPFNHIIKSIISTNRSNEHILYWLSLHNLMSKKRSCLNKLLIDMNNRCNEFLSLFSPFNKEFSLGSKLINSFSEYFSFYSWTHDVKRNLYKLDDITIQTSSNPHSFIVISDTSIKNHVATSISHIYSYNSPVIKTYHHTVNVSTTEAKLFTIRCGINQAVGISYINHIIVITDLLYATKRIFDLSSHPYQIYFAAIFRKLRKFFRKNINNCIKFWDSLMDKNTKSFELLPSFPYKSSWIFVRNAIATLFYHNRGCPFKHQIAKEKISLNFLIMNQILLNYLLSRIVLGFNTPVTQIHYVLALLKLLSIMLLSVNIDLDSSLGRTLGLYGVYPIKFR